MVKRIKSRIVHSVSLAGRDSFADPACPESNRRSPADTVDPSVSDPTIARILKSIYNIKCLCLRKQLSNRNARPGLVVDFVA
jgi:hypothetical protein